MDVIHVHLVLNHVPVVATWLAIPLFALAFLRLPNRDVWLSGTLLLAIAAVTAGGTLLTGEAAEEALEARADVPEALLEEHEERGKLGTGVAVAVGLAALGAWGMRARAPRAALAATLALALASGGVLAWVGYSGGLIRHPELLPPAAGPATR